MKHNKVNRNRIIPPYTESLTKYDNIGSDEPGFLKFDSSGIPFITESGGGGGSDFSDDDPEELGAANPGISDLVSRGDHVHEMPSPSDIGAEAIGIAADLINDHSALPDPHGQYVTEVTLASGAATLASGETRGDLLTRGATLWQRLPPGSDGFGLLSSGASADLIWGRVLRLPSAPANGDIPVQAGGAWTLLPVSTNGKILTLASGLPVWETPAAKADVVSTIAPTVNDDSSDGYVPGVRWLNTVTGLYYVLRNATVGAALWTLITASIMSQFNIGPTVWEDTFNSLSGFSETPRPDPTSSTIWNDIYKDVPTSTQILKPDGIESPSWSI